MQAGAVAGGGDMPWGSWGVEATLRAHWTTWPELFAGELLIGVSDRPVTPGGTGGACAATDGGGGAPTGLVRDVALGSYQACALLSDGTVRCWGHNISGELGDGTTVDHDDPRPVIGLSGITSLQAAYSYGCAESADAVYCWGSDRYGQFGDGRNGDVLSLSPASAFGGGRPMQLALGEYHACALLDGSV